MSDTGRMERAARREPALYPFGTRPLRRLTAEEEIEAPLADRLQSVWAYLCRRARRFVDGLSARERANYSAEDVTQEIVAILMQKDTKWDHTRARYLCFCEQVCRTELINLRARMRAVHAPSNALRRLADYRTRAAAGTLPPRQHRVMRALERALRDGDSLGLHGGPIAADEQAGATVGRLEEADALHAEIVAALREIGPLESMVIGRTYGLFGGSPQGATTISLAIPPGPRRIKAILADAEEALRDRLGPAHQG